MKSKLNSSSHWLLCLFLTLTYQPKWINKSAIMWLPCINSPIISHHTQHKHHACKTNMICLFASFLILTFFISPQTSIQLTLFQVTCHLARECPRKYLHQTLRKVCSFWLEQVPPSSPEWLLSSHSNFFSQVTSLFTGNKGFFPRKLFEISISLNFYSSIMVYFIFKIL